MAPPFSFHEPLENIRAQFSTAPWAVKLFDDPTLQPFYNSVFQPTLTANSFIGNTLKTQDTIAAWQSFQKKLEPGAEDQYPEVLGLIKLGGGVNGHFDTCHGGFVSTLLDETTGNAAELAKPADKSTMTAYLNIQYKKPVMTPSMILARAVLVRKEGRKIYVKGSIEDGNGGVMATAEALYIVVDKIQPAARL
jgi:thioesterase superfamily protein 4